MQIEKTHVLMKEDRQRNRPGREYALVTAAAQLFAEKGYEATTTRQIAKLAGCAEGLIHRYFHGKAGLLAAIVEGRVSQATEELAGAVPLADSLEAEFLHLAAWEMTRVWESREFLKIIVPRALLDGELGNVINQLGFHQPTAVIAERLAQVEPSLSHNDINALADLLPVLSFMYGFVHPIILRRDREAARATALKLARLAVSSIATNPESAREIAVA